MGRHDDVQEMELVLSKMVAHAVILPERAEGNHRAGVVIPLNFLANEPIFDHEEEIKLTAYLTRFANVKLSSFTAQAGHKLPALFIPEEGNPGIIEWMVNCKGDNVELPKQSPSPMQDPDIMTVFLNKSEMRTIWENAVQDTRAQLADPNFQLPEKIVRGHKIDRVWCRADYDLELLQKLIF